MKKLIFILLICCLFFSCGKNKMGVPANLSNVENIVVSEEWAVIQSPYTAFKAEPFLQSKVVEHSRRGDVFPVIGKKLVNNAENQVIWYQFEKGWVLETDLAIYSNKLQADFAASKL